jgi:hypothetical protein
MSAIRAVRSSGQATTEYLVVALALATALFVPVDGAPLALRLLDAIARAWRHYHLLIAQA